CALPISLPTGRWNSCPGTTSPSARAQATATCAASSPSTSAPARSAPSRWHALRPSDEHTRGNWTVRMSKDRLNTPPDAADNETIIPVDFTPIDAERRGFSFRLSPVRVAIGASLAVFVAAGWFVLTARSVFFDVTPLAAEVQVKGGMALRIGPRYLIREGRIDVAVRAEGYYDFISPLEVGTPQAQTFAIALEPLPGFLDLDTGAVSGADVFVDGELVGTTPLTSLELAAGEHVLELRKDRYESLSTSIEMTGRSTRQQLSLELLPAWAVVEFATSPPGATVSVDGVDVGVTPLA